MKTILAILALLTLSGCTSAGTYYYAPPSSYLPQVGYYEPDEESESVQAPDRHVYDASECIGAVVNGRCHGSIIRQPRYHETCYGSWVMGKCVGAQF